MGNTDVGYWLNTTPIDPSGFNRKSITVGTPNNTVPNADGIIPNYWIKHLTFNESTMNPVTSGQFTICYEDPKNTNIYSLIKEGDCFRLWEVFNTNQPIQQQTTAVRFTGFITSIKFSIGTGSNAGTEVTYFFFNFLGQWALQSAVTSLEGQISQGLSNVFANKIPFGQLLALLVKGSLFQYFLSHGGGPDGALLGTGTTYNGTPLPIDIDPNSVQVTEDIWVYAPANMSKLDVLSKALYPYQEIFYTQPSGEITIGYFHSLTRATQPAFMFALGQSPSSAYALSSQGSNNYTNVEIVHSAATVPNRVISTLVNMPFVPPVSGKPNNYIAGVDNPFVRPKELLDSGFFEILQVQTDSISPSMITDPTLMTLLTNNNPQTGYTTTIYEGVPSVAGTYAARRLAQANFQETAMFITQPRQIAESAGDTPLGQMVSVSFPTMLDPYESQLYCHSTITTFSNEGTTFMLQLCKVGSITAYWEQQ